MKSVFKVQNLNVWSFAVCKPSMESQSFLHSVFVCTCRKENGRESKGLVKTQGDRWNQMKAASLISQKTFTALTGLVGVETEDWMSIIREIWFMRNCYLGSPARQRPIETSWWGWPRGKPSGHMLQERAESLHQGVNGCVPIWGEFSALLQLDERFCLRPRTLFWDGCSSLIKMASSLLTHLSSLAKTFMLLTSNEWPLPFSAQVNSWFLSRHSSVWSHALKKQLFCFSSLQICTVFTALDHRHKVVFLFLFIYLFICPVGGLASVSDCCKARKEEQSNSY